MRADKEPEIPKLFLLIDTKVRRFKKLGCNFMISREYVKTPLIRLKSNELCRSLTKLPLPKCGEDARTVMQ